MEYSKGIIVHIQVEYNKKYPLETHLNIKFDEKSSVQ
jgi:hypothetical protein